MTNTNIVSEGANRMRNLDPSKVSPVVGAVTTMLSNQSLTAAESDAIVEAARRASLVHEPWCDAHESDVEGEHCTRHAKSFALYEENARDWVVWANAWKGQPAQIVIDVPSATGSSGASLSPADAVAVIAAFEQNPRSFLDALQATVEAIVGDLDELASRAAANDAYLSAQAEQVSA